MRRSFCTAALLFVGISISSCANGAREFEVYSSAFELQAATAEQVLDKLAMAERAHWTQLHDTGTGTPRFSADAAAYYVNVGDPPLTDSMRQSLEAVKKYNAALVGLANGESAEALTAKFSSIIVNLDQARSALLSDSITSSQELLTVASSFSSEVGAARSVLKLGLTGAARESFRKSLLKAYPAMKGVLLGFRNGSSDLYYAVVSVPQGVSREEKLKDRELFASWVLLIDHTVQAMDIAVVAAMRRSPSGDLATLAEYSMEMRVLAERIRAERNR